MAAPVYQIWVRGLDARPLYSRFDRTQARPPGYNPSVWDAPGVPNPTAPITPAKRQANLNARFPPPIIANDPRSSKLSRGFTREIIVSNYEKLEFKSKYNNIGGWTLYMQDFTPEANALRAQAYGNLSSNPPYFAQGGFGGITVLRNGKIVFSGPVRGFSATGDYYGEDGPMVEFWGTDDTALLDTRLAMAPNPGNDIPARSAGAPWAGYNYSGRQISGTLDFHDTYAAPASQLGTAMQGWGHYSYGSEDVDAPGARSVPAVLRNLVQLNIGPYAAYPFTYPFTYTNASTSSRNGQGQRLYGLRAPLYNETDFTRYYSARRIPFLFMGVASSSDHAYDNTANSEGKNTFPGTPNYLSRARFQSLLARCQDICSFTEEPINPFTLRDDQYRGYQFSINQDDIDVAEYFGPNETAENDQRRKIDGLRFNFAEPRRLEKEIIFSQPLGNLGRYKFEFTQPEVSQTICAGQGEDKVRWFTQGRTPPSYQYGLKEKYADRRDVQFGEEGPPNTLPANSYNLNVIGASNPATIANGGYTAAQEAQQQRMLTELQDAVDVYQRENGVKFNIEIEILSLAQTQYLVDFKLGDWVSVVIGDQPPLPGQITDVEISITRDAGEVIKAIVGTEALGDKFFLFNAIAKNNEDITRIEVAQ